MKRLGLYVHFPFCANKCPYCDFYSVVGYKNIDDYIDALMLQCEDYAESVSPYAIDSVFFGGGTPSIVPEKYMLEFIDRIYDKFNVTLNAEFTMEVNPATVKLSQLKKYRKAGMNRLSFGVQSACDKELKALNRIHTYGEFEKSFEIARKAGFDNINIDLMYGIPEQSFESFCDTLKKIVALSPEHISLYNLKIEDSTPFGAIKDKLALPSEDVEYKMYEYAIEYLGSHGYNQYEISNFAKPGKECVHNLKYWTCAEYLGLGTGAHSYFRNTRFSFIKDIDSFIEAIKDLDDDTKLTDENYTINPEERAGEYIMLSLRLANGINTLEFERIFGMNFEKMFVDLLPAYLENGFMKKTSVGYAFTTKGMYVSNYILSSMLDFSSSIDENIANGTDK
ncbi:MAG: radical SAM family heme chaperone HemW [Clostridia bacterium]|nr:radical SAM family heme chaperone HemW [Clostridia bacterium]